MALTRPGAPAPTSSVSNAQSLANRSAQNANRAGNTAMQAASPSVPVEITASDGQHFTVSFEDVRNFICPKATDAEQIKAVIKRAPLGRYDRKIARLRYVDQLCQADIAARVPYCRTSIGNRLKIIDKILNV